MTKDILSKVLKKFTSDIGLSVVTSAELEFYFDKKEEEIDNKCILAALSQINGRGIENSGIYPESGKRQYELVLEKTDSPITTAENIEEVKNILKNEARKLGIKAIFHPKPFKERPGSGLHINISLNKDGKNIFASNEEAPELLYSIGGLCSLMPQSMLFFAPNNDSYKRFTKGMDNHVPSNVSWGGNNRTVAIRIPTSTLSPEEKHIEHRICGSDADPYLAISAILLGIAHGISNKLSPPQRIFGNAFDKQYSLKPLPKDLTEAKKAYKEGGYVKYYLPFNG